MALLDLVAGAGTQPDIVARLKAVLPTGWFADTTPILDGVLNGLAASWSGQFGLLETVQAQSRIATAGGVFLDLAAQDFFGSSLARLPGEPDDALRARIFRAMLAPRNTRAAVASGVAALTGRPPHIVEPGRIADTGAYDNAATLAYNVAGSWGSTALPFQIFVHAYRPVGTGVANSLGYGIGQGGYGVGAVQYTTPLMAASQVHDADIATAIAQVLPVATTAWLAISDS